MIIHYSELAPAFASCAVWQYLFCGLRRFQLFYAQLRMHFFVFLDKNLSLSSSVDDFINIFASWQCNADQTEMLNGKAKWPTIDDILFIARSQYYDLVRGNKWHDIYTKASPCGLVAGDTPFGNANSLAVRLHHFPRAMVDYYLHLWVFHYDRTHPLVYCVGRWIISFSMSIFWLQGMVASSPSLSLSWSSFCLYFNYHYSLEFVQCHNFHTRKVCHNGGWVRRLRHLSHFQ